MRLIKLFFLSVTTIIVYWLLQVQIKALPYYNVAQTLNKNKTKSAGDDGIIVHKNENNSRYIRENVCKKYVSTTRQNIYLINNKNVCAERGGLNQLLVFVHSAPKHFERRTVIRQTWGSISNIENFSIKRVFVLGRQNNKTVQTTINHEHALHRDIVQGNFLDTYFNLSQKHILGIRWASEFCKTAKYIIKADDDVFVNPFGFFRDLVIKYPNITQTILCNIRPNGTDPIQRNGARKYKWGVNSDIFKNLTHWPFTFCQGYFVIYSSDIVSAIYNAAKRNCMPYVWLDDAYVTGILAHNVGNIRHSALKGLRNHITYIHDKLFEKMHKHWKHLQLHHKVK